MNITAPFVLRRDVLLTPCAELAEEVRGRIAYDEGDFTLSRRHGRSHAQVVDGDTAALLALFREPRTIVDAVVENSRVLGKDAAAWLDELLPHIDAFVSNRVLVPAGSDDEEEIRPSYDNGATFDDWTIVRCLHLLEDGEVYELCRGDERAALKIARGAAGDLAAMFENEAAILRHLDGSGIAPRLIDARRCDERPYLVLEWIAGTDASVVAAKRRHDRASLIELCASIAETYARLHERGVLHADVHPRNILASDRVTPIDFGLSRFVDAPPRVGRGGTYSYMEPEYLAAHRERRTLAATAAGEQYAIAVTLYFLIAGQSHVELRLDREEMLRQLEHDPPLPFASRGIPPWPEVESILFRALAKDPSQRFSSVRELATHLAAARDAAIVESLATPLSSDAHACLERTLQSFARGGAMFATRYTTPPFASINYGCAGAAVALLRMAEARSDPKLLALADVWRSRAVSLLARDDAYYNDDRGLTHQQLGDITPYHTEAGVHAAAAMVAAAMGHVSATHGAIDAFIRASSRPCANLDLTLGRSGSLLAASMLLPVADAAPLRAFGAETMRAIWTQLDAEPPLTTWRSYLGMAHGWCGFLYATLRWCAASGDPLPQQLEARLHELASLHTRDGRSARWPVKRRETDHLSAWCHGTAGYVFLFTLAHQLLGDAPWLELAEAAAWHTWQDERSVANLCCGTAGRAYALLNLYKHTGATEWLSRARHLANHAAANLERTTWRANGLWKGDLGVAALIADLSAPEQARMPFFE